MASGCYLIADGSKLLAVLRLFVVDLEALEELVELGASDGVTLSNTFFLEQMGWYGLGLTLQFTHPVTKMNPYTGRK